LTYVQISNIVEEKEHIVQQLLPDPMTTLLNRSKHERMSFSEKLLVYKMIKVQKQSYKEITNVLGLSISTVYSIVKDFEIGKQSSPFPLKMLGSKLMKSKVVQN
jgi:hypothetical protein